MEPAELVAEAVVLHATLFGGTASPAARFARLRDEVVATWKLRSESELVESLEQRWEAVAGASFRNAASYAHLVARLQRAREPALIPVGLLDLLLSARRETLHTRAIGAFLDPVRASELGASLLQAFVERLREQMPRDVTSGARFREAQVTIEPEYVVRGRRGRGNRARYPTPDLRVVVPRSDADAPLVIIVENKIDDTDRENQLASYAQCTRDVHGSDVVLVYLTPTGASPTQADVEGDWIPFSYQDLAIAWRAVLRSCDAGNAYEPWLEALRAYLSTVVRHICGLRVEGLTGRAGQSRIVPYLEAAVGGLG